MFKMMGATDLYVEEASSDDGHDSGGASDVESWSCRSCGSASWGWLATWPGRWLAAG